MKRLFLLGSLVVFTLLLALGSSAFASGKPLKMKIDVSSSTLGRLCVPVKSSGKWKLRYKLTTAAQDAWNEAELAAGKRFEERPAAGEYLVEVLPENVYGIDFSGESSSLLEITEWGDIQWTTMSDAFSGCSRMTIADGAGSPHFVGNVDCSGMFSNCKAMNSATLLDWDVSNVSYMNGIFDGCNAFNQPLGAWTLTKCQSFSFSPATSDGNYQNTLKAWAQKNNLSKEMEVYASGLFYGKAKEAREQLIKKHQWRFYGDFEQMPEPRGERPFAFVIKVFNEPKPELEVSIPIYGRNVSLTYQKIDGTSLGEATTLKEQNLKATFKATPDTKYLIKIAPKGLLSFWADGIRSAHIKEVCQWGDVAWLTLEHAFAKTDLEKIAAVDEEQNLYGTKGDTPDLSHVKNCSGMFGLARKLKTGLAAWDMSKVEYMADFLRGADQFEENLKGWKLSSCKTLERAFDGVKWTPEVYGEILTAWGEQLPNLQEEVKVGVRGLSYPEAAAEARQKLIDQKKWIFDGDHLPYALVLKIDRYIRQFFVGVPVSLDFKKYGIEDSEPVTWTVTPASQQANLVNKKFTPTTPGEVTITVSVAENTQHKALSAKVTFTVLERPTDITLACDKITIDNTNRKFTITAGEQYRLTATTPPLTTLPVLYWNVNDNDDAIQYNEDGSVILKLENAKNTPYSLHITIANSGESYSQLFRSYAVTVEPRKEVLVSPTTLVLFTDGTEAQKKATLSATVNGLTNKQVTWSVESGEAFVTVNATTGEVTAKAKGVATVIATSQQDLMIKGKCSVTVSELITGVTIAKDGAPVTGKIEAVQNKHFVLKATVLPEGVPQEVTWEYKKSQFSTEAVPEGMKFIPLVTGQDFSIKALSAADPTQSASVTVDVKADGTITPPIQQPGAPTGITIAEADKNVSLKKDESREIVLTFTPSDNVNKEVTVTQEPADALTATVVEGKLTLKADKPFDKETTVTVTVVSKVNATAKAVCTVTLITPPIQQPVAPTGITIAEADKNVSLKKDESREIVLTFTPSDNVNKEVTVTQEPADALTATVVDGKLTLKADKPFEKETTVMVTVVSKVNATAKAVCIVTLKPEKGGAVEDALLASIVVAPNPFSSHLRILNPEGVAVRYELVNAAGMVVRAGALTGSEAIVDTESLPAGLYFVRLEAQNGAKKSVTVSK